MTEATGEKKPAQGGEGVQLVDVEMLVIARYGGDYCVSTLGGQYSSPPTCAQSVAADIAWICTLDPGALGRADSINGSAGMEAVAHLRGLLDALGSSLFMKGELPSTFEVPGLGRWTFDASPACTLQ